MNLKNGKKLLGFTLLIQALSFGQTQVDLRTQSKNIDFSQSASVRPFRTGTSLPATCNAGEMYFKTDAAPGVNTYGCVATNTWSVEGGSGGGGTSDPLFLVTRTSSTVLTIGAPCSISTPCIYRVGAISFTIVTPATATVTSGNGNVFLYINNTGALTVGIPTSVTTAVTCSGCQVAANVLQFPADAIPLTVWNASSGTWDSTGTDYRALLSGGRNFVPGQNITISETGSTITIAAALKTLPTGTKPTCSVSAWGVVWHTHGATGVKDDVQVCAKDSSDAYAWRTIY